MTTKAHKLLTGTDLHENKGAAAASDDYVATATGGATVWKKLTAANLATTGNPFGAQLLHVTHQVSSGTDSGAATGATWNTRPLNTSLTNEITSATLSSNQISLPAGTYFAQAWEKALAGNVSINSGFATSPMALLLSSGQVVITRLVHRPTTGP